MKYETKEVRGGASVRVIASERTWMEGEALRQLEATAVLPGMRRVVGMPDLHPGKGSPVGAAFLTDGIIYPTLIGSDIGCGMALWSTDLSARKARPERMAARLEGLDQPWNDEVAPWLAERGLSPTPQDASLGTIGRGNHFAEVMVVHEIRDQATFTGLGLDQERLAVLVHSGSRGLGEAVLRRHVDQHGHAGILAGAPEGADYLDDYAHAVRWAEANRALCAHRVLDALGADALPVLDVCHNSWTPAFFDGCSCVLHRKGAAPADQGPVMIPGSRGDLSFLVQPVPGRDDALLSLAHGAGRKVARSNARGLLSKRYSKADLLTNPWGGRIVCGNELLAWEEAPECYKDAAGVIGDLEEAGLISVVAAFRPMVTFKTSSETERRFQGRNGGRNSWKEERNAMRRAKETLQ